MYVIIDTNKLADYSRDYVKNEAKEAIVDDKLVVALDMDNVHGYADDISHWHSDGLDCAGNVYDAQWDIIPDTDELELCDTADWDCVELYFDRHYINSEAIIEVVRDNRKKYEEFHKIWECMW